MSSGNIVSLIEARQIAADFMEYIYNVSTFAEVAGSVRRLKSHVSDIDIVIEPHNTVAIWNRIEVMLENGTITKALRPGGKTCWGDKLRAIRYLNTTIEIHLCQPENRGYILWLNTGPGDKNNYLMGQLIKYKSNVRFHDGFAWHVDYNENHPRFNRGLGYAKLAKLNIPDEQTFYAMMGMPFIAPHNRNEIMYRRYLEREIKTPPLEALHLRYVETIPTKQMGLF